MDQYGARLRKIDGWTICWARDTQIKWLGSKSAATNLNPSRERGNAGNNARSLLLAARLSMHSLLKFTPFIPGSVAVFGYGEGVCVCLLP